MAKKKLTLGMAAAAAAGTAVYVAKKSQNKKNQNGTSQNDIRDKANSGWSLTQHKINSSLSIQSSINPVFSRHIAY